MLTTIKIMSKLSCHEFTRIRVVIKFNKKKTIIVLIVLGVRSLANARVELDSFKSSKY